MRTGKSAAPFSSAPKTLDITPLKLGTWIRLRRSAGVMPSVTVYRIALWRTLRWASTTPLGAPVDPEVKWMHAVASAPGSGPAHPGPAGTSSSTSSARSPAASAAAAGAPSRLTTSRRARTSSRIAASRAGGSEGSSGTYGRPAKRAPSVAATLGTPWCRRRATGVPAGPPPRTTIARAMAPARASSSP